MFSKNYWIYKKFKINHLIYIKIFKFLAFRKRKYILSVPKFVLLSRMVYCLIKTIMNRLIINSVFHMWSLHKNRVHWEFQSSFKSLLKIPEKLSWDENIPNFFKSWKVIIVEENWYVNFTMKTPENDFLVNDLSISVTDVGKHFSQFSNFPES